MSSGTEAIMGSPRKLQHQLRHGELDRWLWQSHGLKRAMGSQPVANKAIGSTKETESSFHLGENAARARSESPRTAQTIKSNLGGAAEETAGKCAGGNRPDRDPGARG